MADDLPSVQDVDVVVCDLPERQKRMFQAVSRATGVAQQRQKGYYDLKVKGPEISVGDFVVYENKTNLRAGEICSLRLPFKDPLFRVIRKLSDVNYEITSDGGPGKIVHYNQIKQVKGPARDLEEEEPPAETLEEGEPPAAALEEEEPRGAIPIDGVADGILPQPRRSDRVRQRPKHLMDYDTRNPDVQWIP
jgi:hypothetical protein